MNKEGRGVSVMSLIKTARSQLLNAKEQESQGDLKVGENTLDDLLHTGLTSASQAIHEGTPDCSVHIRVGTWLPQIDSNIPNTA